MRYPSMASRPRLHSSRSTRSLRHSLNVPSCASFSASQLLCHVSRPDGAAPESKSGRPGAQDSGTGSERWGSSHGEAGGEGGEGIRGGPRQSARGEA